MKLRPLLLLSLLCGGTSLAHAADGPTAPPAKSSLPTASVSDGVDGARDRFQRGVELYKDGNFDAALAEFSRAYQLQPNYRILFNLAQTQMERHDSVEAQRLLRQYLNDGGAELVPERRAQVERDLVALQKRVAELRVSVDVPGAELLIDGAVVGVSPLGSSLWVNAGVRQLLVRKPGHLPTERSLSVPGGESVTLELHLEPEPVAPRTVEPVVQARAPRRPGVETKVWVGLASTAVLAGTAATFGLLTLQADRKLDRELGRFPGDPSAIEKRQDNQRTLALLSDAFSGATLIAAGATLYFVLAGPSTATPAPDSAVAAAAPRLVAGVSGSQLVLSGAFQ